MMGRVTLAFLLALIAFIGVFGFALAATRTLERYEASLAEAQFTHILSGTAEALEKNMQLGLPLVELERSVPVLERAMERAPGIIAADVISADGITQFSTDRGALGEKIPEPWANAIAEARGRVWRDARPDSVTMGIPLRNDFAQTEGWTAVIVDRRVLPAPLTEAMPILRRGAPVIALTTLLAALIGYVFVARANASPWTDLTAEPPPKGSRDRLDDANIRAVEATRDIANRLAAVSVELKRLDAEV